MISYNVTGGSDDGKHLFTFRGKKKPWPAMEVRGRPTSNVS